MEQSGYHVTYNGTEYPSLRAFADAYQLNYPKVVAYHRKGILPDEIIQKCQFSTASKAKRSSAEGGRRNHDVEFNGVQYASIYAAADALGISPARVYSVRQRRNCSPEAAIQYVLEHSIPAGRDTAPAAARPCIIEGIEYPSQEAALAAYRMKRITVYSRMQREGISFEDAIVRGKHSTLYRKPASTLFSKLHLISTDKELTSPEILADLVRSLTYYRCKTEILQDMLTGVPAVLVEDQTFICYNNEARGIEMMTELDFPLDADAINIFNEYYVATKLFYSKARGKLVLAAFQSAKERGQRIEPLLNAWFSYSSIRDTLLRRFLPEQMLEGTASMQKTTEPAEI